MDIEYYYEDDRISSVSSDADNTDEVEVLRENLRYFLSGGAEGFPEMEMFNEINNARKYPELVPLCNQVVEIISKLKQKKLASLEQRVSKCFCIMRRDIKTYRSMGFYSELIEQRIADRDKFQEMVLPPKLPDTSNLSGLASVRIIQKYKQQLHNFTHDREERLEKLLQRGTQTRIMKIAVFIYNAYLKIRDSIWMIDSETCELSMTVNNVQRYYNLLKLATKIEKHGSFIDPHSLNRLTEYQSRFLKREIEKRWFKNFAIKDVRTKLSPKEFRRQFIGTGTAVSQYLHPESTDLLSTDVGLHLAPNEVLLSPEMFERFERFSNDSTLCFVELRYQNNLQYGIYNPAHIGICDYSYLMLPYNIRSRLNIPETSAEKIPIKIRPIKLPAVTKIEFIVKQSDSDTSLALTEINLEEKISDTINQLQSSNINFFLQEGDEFEIKHEKGVVRIKINKLFPMIAAIPTCSEIPFDVTLDVDVGSGRES